MRYLGIMAAAGAVGYAAGGWIAGALLAIAAGIVAVGLGEPWATATSPREGDDFEGEVAEPSRREAGYPRIFTRSGVDAGEVMEARP